MLKYEFIVYWSEDDQAYISECPELPGCMADGKTYQESIDNLEQIALEWIETATLAGMEIPTPKGRLLYA